MKSKPTEAMSIENRVERLEQLVQRHGLSEDEDHPYTPSKGKPKPEVEDGGSSTGAENTAGKDPAAAEGSGVVKPSTTTKPKPSKPVKHVAAKKTVAAKKATGKRS